MTFDAEYHSSSSSSSSCSPARPRRPRRPALPPPCTSSSSSEVLFRLFTSVVLLFRIRHLPRPGRGRLFVTFLRRQRRRRQRRRQRRRNSEERGRILPNSAFTDVPSPTAEFYAEFFRLPRPLSPHLPRRPPFYGDNIASTSSSPSCCNVFI